MPLPPKGDPQRPLELAVRSVRLLAVLFLLVSTCAGFGVVSMLMSHNRTSMVTRVVGLALLLVYFVPGVIYLVLSIYLRQRAVWAVTTGIVVASVQLLFSLLGILGMVFRGPTNLIAIGVGAFVILALAQLIQHLSQSYAAIRAWQGGQVRGFEPLPILPVDVTPVDDGTRGGAAGL